MVEIWKKWREWMEKDTVGRERAGEPRVMGYVGRMRAGSAAAYITNAELIC